MGAKKAAKQNFLFRWLSALNLVLIENEILDFNLKILKQKKKTIDFGERTSFMAPRRAHVWPTTDLNITYVPYGKYIFVAKFLSFL